MSKGSVARWLHPWTLEILGLGPHLATSAVWPQSSSLISLCLGSLSTTCGWWKGGSEDWTCKQLPSTYIALATCQQPLGAGLSSEPPLHLSTVRNGPKTEILKAGDFLSEDIKWCQKTFLGVTTQGVDATGISWVETRMWLNILQCPGQPLQQRIILPPMSRNPKC